MYYQRNIAALILASISFVLGVFFIVIHPNIILRIVLLGLSSLLFLIAVLFLINIKKFHPRDQKRKILESVFMIIVALVMIVFYGEVTRILLGLYLMVTPIIHIIEYKGQDKLHFDILKIVIGIIVIISFDKFIQFTMIGLGICLLSFSLSLLFLLFKNKNDRNTPNIIIKYFIKR